MGSLTTAEREGLRDGDAGLQSGRGETRAGTVEHNGSMGRDAGRLLSGQFKTPDSAATMANELLTPPDTESQAAAAPAEGCDLDPMFGFAVEEQPIWVGLYDSIHEIFFPAKLPPLELTSTPIPVPDRMAVKPNPWAIGISTTVNLALLLALLVFGVRKIIEVNQQKLHNTDIDVGLWQPTAPKADSANGGGGGGGEHNIVDPIKGKLPKIEKDPIVPPQVQTIDHPLLPMQAAIDVQKNIVLPDNPMLPNIGVTRSANVTLASNGQGSGGGMGTGSGGGLGSGSGNGYGPGRGGGAGGGLYHVGGGVTAPVALNSVEAEFSDEARRAKYQGVCLISLIVDAQGNPQNPRVIRALGMGLDEKALEAVRKYKFRPAMKDGRTPVPVMITVEVNFRLY
jgi:TonB family protein